MAPRKSNEEFQKEAKEKNKKLTVLGEYTGVSNNILCKCNLCNEEFITTPDKVLRGVGHTLLCYSINNKRTTKEFIEEIKIKNKYVEILGEYISLQEKIKCKCKLCNEEYYTTPAILLQGRKHKKCYNESQKKSNADFIKEFSEKNNKVELLGEYAGVHKKIKVKCLFCEEILYIEAGSLLKNYGHHVCNLSRISYEEFMKKLIEKYNDKFEINKEDYILFSEKCKVKCLDCGHIFETLPTVLLRGNFGCKNCYGGIITTEILKERIKIKNENVILLSEYKTAKEKVNLYCNIHKLNFSLSPEHIKGGGRKICPECNIDLLKKSLLKTNEDIIKEIQNINPHINFIDSYEGMTKGKYKIFCNKCKTESYMNISYITTCKIIGCVNCSPKSKGEIFIKEFLEKNKILFKREKTFDGCKDKGKLRFDFYLPDYNLCIEFQGGQHYSNRFFINRKDLSNGFGDLQKKDEIKRNFCKNTNINLLEISYKDIDNIEEILEKYLSITK